MALKLIEIKKSEIGFVIDTMTNQSVSFDLREKIMININELSLLELHIVYNNLKPKRN